MAGLELAGGSSNLPLPANFTPCLPAVDQLTEARPARDDEKQRPPPATKQKGAHNKTSAHPTKDRPMSDRPNTHGSAGVNQPAKPLSAAVAAQPPKRTFEDLVKGDKFKSQLTAALPKHLTPDRFVRVVLTAAMRTPLLLQCTQDSLFLALLNCAASGLEPDGRRAHLIPYKNNKKGIYECQLIFDYKGLAELAMHSGLVSNIHAELVCDKDEFEEDRGQVLKHKINRREPRGEPYAAYCLVRMKDGTEKAEVMSRFEIEDIRDRSQGYIAFQKGYTKTNPWVTDEGEMWKKTVARRVFKWIPLSPEIRENIERDDEQRGEINVTGSAALPSLGELMPHGDPEGEDGVSFNPGADGAEPGGDEPVIERAPTREDLEMQVKNLLLDHDVGETQLFIYAKKVKLVPEGIDELFALPTEVLQKLSVAIPSLSTKKGGAK